MSGKSAKRQRKAIDKAMDSHYKTLIERLNSRPWIKRLGLALLLAWPGKRGQLWIRTAKGRLINEDQEGEK